MQERRARQNRKRRRRTLSLSVALCGLLAGSYAAGAATHAALLTSLPIVEGVPIMESLRDPSLVRVRITRGTQKAWIDVSPSTLRWDWRLWRQMHVEDWDRVSVEGRAPALRQMLRAYADLVDAPALWERLSPADWDVVPQPIRAVAFRNMCEYWTDFYGIGSSQGVARATFSAVAAAIVMSESWFDHRAVNVNPWGNRDLGVAQASDSARERLRDRYRSGSVDVWLEDEDYFNPFNGTRFVVIWLRDLLHALNGDLNAAIRAYHRGVHRASVVDQPGQRYLATVMSRYGNYMTPSSRSATWSYLWRRGARAPLQAVPLRRAVTRMAPAVTADGS